MTESVNGTTLTSATGSIVDATGVVWTLHASTASGQVIYRNGVAAGFSSNVKSLVYSGKVLFQQNTAGSWWNWINNAWAAASAPLLFTVSANLTTVKAGASTAITDASGVKWTLTSTAQVAANGVVDPTTSGVAQLVWVNAALWQQNTAGNWWTWVNAGWLAGAAPVLVTPSVNLTVVKFGAAITDALGAKWTLTSGGQISKDGVVDATTSGVTQLAYVGGTVWQQTTGGLWWGMVAGAWSPAAGTATSPLSAAPVGVPVVPPVVPPGNPPVSVPPVSNSNPRILVDLNTALLGASAPIQGDPIIATPEVFGVSMGSNWDGFASLNTPGWRNAVAAVGGFYFYRITPDSWYSPNANSTDAPGSMPEIDNILNTFLTMGYKGRIVCGMGSSPPPWGTDAASYGRLTVQIAKYSRAKGMPITYFESYNEPEGKFSSNSGSNATITANIASAMKDALLAAGAPYNSSAYVVAGPVTKNSSEYADQATHVRQYVQTMGSRLQCISHHFYAGQNFGASNNADTNAQIALAADDTHGYGSQIRTTKNLGKVPVMLTEYNMNGMPTDNEESQNNNGAVFNTLAMLDAIKRGNLEMAAIWDAIENKPRNSGSGDVYGIINGANGSLGATTTLQGAAVPPFAIFPVGWTLGRLANVMPGAVVVSTLDASLQADLYVMATKTSNGGLKGVCIVNRGTASHTVNLAISSGPATVTYFEVSANFPAAPYGAGTGPKIVSGMTAATLANLTIVPRSVIMISP